MTVDPGTNPGITPSEQGTQREGSGSQNQATNAGGSQGQRHHHGENKGRSQPRDQQAPKTAKFEGRCEDLTGHVYDYANPRQAADQFTKTTHEICKYVGRTYKYGADTKIALETMAEPVFTEPTDPPATATRTQV
jgi:hypothetical protein